MGRNQQPDATTERVVRVTLALCRSANGLTTKEAAQLAGITPVGAYKMLEQLCRVLPLWKDVEGRYRFLRDSDFDEVTE